MITRVKIKNFRSIASVDVSLNDLTVLVGRNGAGKSNFVDALRFVQESLRQGLDYAIQRRNGLQAIRRWSPRGRPYDIEISVFVRRSKMYGEWSFTLSGGKEPGYKIKRESAKVGTSATTISEEYEIKDGEWAIKPVLIQGEQSALDQQNTERISRLSRLWNSTTFFLQRAQVGPQSLLFDLYRSLTNSNFLTIYPNTIREPQRFSTTTRMGDTGENFASALSQMIQANQRNHGSYPDLLHTLSDIVADVSDIRVQAIGGYLVTELHHAYNGTRESEKNPWFDLSQESDGTVRVLGLLVGLYQSMPRFGLIAIEEPEMNIHPGALAILADTVGDVASRRQLLITTQSPDLISRFDIKNIKVVERVVGTTTIGDVTQSQVRAVEKQLFTSGDLLRIEGLHSDAAAEIIGA